MDRKTSLARLSSGDKPHRVSDPEMVLCSSKAGPGLLPAPCIAWTELLRWFALSLHWWGSLNTHLDFSHQLGASCLAPPQLAVTSADVLRVTHDACGGAGGWKWGAMGSSLSSYNTHTHSPVKCDSTQRCLWLETRPDRIIICYDVWPAMTCYMGQAPGSDKRGTISLHLIDYELRAVCSLQDLNQWPKSERLFFPMLKLLFFPIHEFPCWLQINCCFKKINPTFCLNILRFRTECFG